MKLKKLRIPKEPRVNASVEAKQAYIKKLAEIQKENNRREAENKKSVALTKKIRDMKSRMK